MAPTTRFEAEGMARGYRVIAGVDEAGRGPWAGPVVAAAVIFEGRRVPRGLDDSKKLTAMAREVAYDKIMAKAMVGIGIADVATIDRINILQATLQAMRDAIRALPCLPDLALVDGDRAPALDCAIRTVIEGDALSVSVAAASIIAKVTRDRIMCALDETCPGYDFHQHKGYGTPEHRAALKRLGPSCMHRMSFPVMHELQGEYSPLFYLLKAQLDAARSRIALDEVEAQLRAQAAELAEQECKKLRLLMLRRWKFIGQTHA
jgi:ribonuclease HII